MEGFSGGSNMREKKANDDYDDNEKVQNIRVYNSFFLPSPTPKNEHSQSFENDFYPFVVDAS